MKTFGKAVAYIRYDTIVEFNVDSTCNIDDGFAGFTNSSGFARLRSEKNTHSHFLPYLHE